VRTPALSLVDLVAARHFSPYTDLPAFIDHSDPTFGEEPPDLYAASCRWGRKGERTALQTRSHAIAVGQPLPTLPLWLGSDLPVPHEL
jgi:hypothetical protein